ncbi:hypothetical protein DPSP01_012817 [Paraphaeosphaeria sporulosa]
MRSLFVAVAAVAAVCASCTPASPMAGAMTKPMPAPAPPAAPAGPTVGQEAAVTVSSVGSCPQDCWNEGAVQAGCDPNADDSCLCGPFFDAVTTCVSQTCSIGDSLQVLNTLEPLC